MNRIKYYQLLILVAIGVAALLRLPQLDLRPMHADEAVQAARFRDLWQQGRYVYDPNEFHGPTLMYATLPSVVLSGAKDFGSTTEATYRLVPALFGIGVVVLLLALLDALGTRATLLAALFVAVSPAMVFYSRYYIHEMLLVFFSLAAIAFGWRYSVSRKLVWCLLAGACVGLMQATKETAAISYLAAGFATLAVVLDMWRMRRLQPAELGAPAGAGREPWPWWHLVAGGAVAVLVAVVFLSSMFTNMRGPVDGLLTYAVWLNRAGGESPHVYPWSFYLQRLVWWRVGQGPVFSEGLVVFLAAIGVVRVITVRRGTVTDGQINFMRWLACYTLAVAIIYCVIPYKTPWCLLQFLIGMLLLAGIGASRLLPSSRPATSRAIIATLLVAGGIAAGIGHLGWQAYRASRVLCADPANPYVYAHTSPDTLRMIERVQGLAETSPSSWNTPVKVIWTDAYYWPLPWYLRRLENAEYWQSMPEDPAAPIVIAVPQYDQELTAKLGDDYIMTGYYELRPAVLMQLWVKYDLWVAYLKRIGRI